MLRFLGFLPEKKITRTGKPGSKDARKAAAKAVSIPRVKPAPKVAATVIPKGAKPNAEGLYLHKGNEPPFGAAIIVWGAVGEGEWYWRPEDASAASVVARPAHNRDSAVAKTSRDRWAYRYPTAEFAWELAGHWAMWQELRKLHPTAHNDDIIAAIAKERGQKDFYVKRSLASFPKWRQVGEKPLEKGEKRAVRDIAPDGWSEWDYPDHCAWVNVYMSQDEFSKRAGLVYDMDPDRRYFVHWKEGRWMYRMGSVVRNPQSPMFGMISGGRVQAAKPQTSREDEKLEARLEAIRDERPSGRR